MGRRGLEVVLVPTGDDQKADMQRANKGARFYRYYSNRFILVSGSTDGKCFLSSQPGHIYKCMRKKGVPRSKFLFESKSRNTVENVIYSCKLMKEKGIEGVSVVSNPLHLLRFYLIFNKAKKDKYVDKDLRVRYVPVSESLIDLFKELCHESMSHIKYFLLRRRNLSSYLKE